MEKRFETSMRAPVRQRFSTASQSVPADGGDSIRLKRTLEDMESHRCHPQAHAVSCF
jgi:hypothetical protein